MRKVPGSSPGGRTIIERNNMRKKLFWLFMFVALLIVAANAQTSYYISNSIGSDSYNGLAPEWDGRSGPKQTISAANNILQNMMPGDRLRFKRRDVWDTMETIIIDSHANGTRIDAYGVGVRPMIRHNGTASAQDRIMYFYGDTPEVCENITVTGLHLTTTSPSSNRPLGIRLYCAEQGEINNITFRDLLIEETKQGISNHFATYLLVENCVIRNNHTVGADPHQDSSGIYSKADHLTIRYCDFSDNGTDHMRDHNAYLSQSNYLVFEYNWIHGGLGDVKVKAGVQQLIRRNRFYDLDRGAIAFGGNVVSANRDCVIEQNDFYDVRDAIVICDQNSPSNPNGNGTINAIIRNNRFHGRKSGHAPQEYNSFIRIRQDYIENMSIHNNMFFDITEETLIRVQHTGPDGLHIYDNYLRSDDLEWPIFMFLDNPALTGVYLDRNIYNFPQGFLWNIDGNLYRSLEHFQEEYPGQEQNGVQL